MPIADWNPSASLEALRRRADVLARVRRFFAERGVLEVETPVLSTAGVTDPHLQNLITHYHGPLTKATRFYLHTSPEFFMKRLLAAGAGSIYQICRAFRDGEAGRLHNPEFTLLEWYRVGFDHERLMREVADLVIEVLADRAPTGPVETLSYGEAFERYAGIDPHQSSGAQLQACARTHGVEIAGLLEEDIDGWRDLLLTHLVEPHLGRGRLTFLHDYPASQAALARLRPNLPRLACRFELYLEGVELANGYHELLDAREQRRRFENDQAVRAQRGLMTPSVDERLLAALVAGIPDCAGVALGIDRLIMLALGAASLADVLAFPIDRT